MKTVLIFLNGYYDRNRLNFYGQEVENAQNNGFPIICADGGICIFDLLNGIGNKTFIPDVHIGDMDSINGKTTEAKRTVEKWIGQTDKDFTDGQLALDYALKEFNSQHLIFFGGLPKVDQYEIDHFIGNLKLLRLGSYLTEEKQFAYKAEMRDPLQTIHYVKSTVRLKRKNSGMQRVSLFSDEKNTIVKHSRNLRWNLRTFHIHPVLTNALRNEFIQDAEWVEIQLTENSTPLYVIHNWYDEQTT